MRTEDRSRSRKRVFVFDLRDVFFVVTLVAAFLAMRRWAMVVEDERIVVLGIALVGVAMPVYAAWHRASYLSIYLLTAALSLLLATEFACECVFESPGTAYLRRSSIQAQYSSDPELNTIGVIALTIVMTMVGGTLGAICRFFRRPSRVSTNS